MLRFYRTEGNINVPIQMETPCDGCWVNAVSPTPEEIRQLTEELGIERSFVDAALDEEESSRIETEDDQTLIIIDTPLAVTERSDTLVYTTMPIGLILTPQYTVTICSNETPVITDFTKGFVKNVRVDQKTQFMLLIMLRIAQSYLSHLKHINKLSTHVEGELHKSMKNKELFQLYGLEKSLVYFSTSLKANEVTLEKILRGRIIRLQEEDQEFLEDVLIEYKQAIEMSNIYSSILSGTMDTFSSIISNNLNSVMKVLTIITLLMAIPTMIFSYYGMNIKFLWLPSEVWVLLGSAAIVVVAGILLWRKRY